MGMRWLCHLILLGCPGFPLFGPPVLLAFAHFLTQSYLSFDTIHTPHPPKQLGATAMYTVLD